MPFEDFVARALASATADPGAAIRAAQKYEHVDQWIARQKLNAAAVGAGAMFLPGVHVMLLLVDLSYLMRTMMFCAWGVAKFYQKPIHPDIDRQMIFGLWSGGIPREVVEAGITVGTVGGVLYVYGTHQFLVTTLSFAVTQASSAAATKFGMKGSAKVVGAAAGTAAKQLMTKYGPKIASKFGGKLLAKFAGGFGCVVGPLVGAILNAYFVGRVAHSAKIYYANKNVAPEE